MNKRFLFCFLFSISYLAAFTQNGGIDSLRHQLSVVRDDSSRVLILSELSYDYSAVNADSTISIAQRAIEISRRINFPRGEVRGLISLGNAYDTRGDLPRALALVFHGLSIAEENHLPFEKIECLNNMGDIFWDLNDFPRSISTFKQALQFSKVFKNQSEVRYGRLRAEESLGAVFMLNGQLDSAFFHLQKLYNETLTDPYWHASTMMFFGDLQFRMGNRDKGLDNLRQSINLFQMDNNHYSLGDACRFISECFRQLNMIDSSISYAKRGLAEAKSIGYRSPMLYNSRALAELYESSDLREALHYRKVFDTVNDIYYGPAKVRDLQKALSDEQERQRKMEEATVAYHNRLKQYGLLGGICMVLSVALMLYRNNQQKKKANFQLNLQKEKVESTLAELKSTQSQLILSEKMASLGELTAGIAHEIQNPLNFVNNFSEVNTELMEELKTEALEGNKEEVLKIADNILANEEKINYHGKRADAIVKSMLQHSRSGQGRKESVNINAIVDECLKLSYRSFRAKDKSFQASLQTEFDESIGTLSVIQQDIVRVLLNIFNNGFYAVNEKKKEQIQGYDPVVSVRTRKVGDNVEISMKDNGMGIPKKLIDKIFQPFFTTKPTGQGTGMGLSLSYDMVKAHGGELKVESKEREGAEFVLQLPISQF